MRDGSMMLGWVTHAVRDGSMMLGWVTHAVRDGAGMQKRLALCVSLGYNREVEAIERRFVGTNAWENGYGSTEYTGDDIGFFEHA